MYNSLSYKILIRAINLFSLIYEESILGRIISKVRHIFNNSLFIGIFIKERKIFEKSLFLKTYSKVIDFGSSFLRNINQIYKKTGRYSILYRSIEKILPTKIGIVLYEMKLWLMIGVFIFPFLPNILSLVYMFFLLLLFIANNILKSSNPLTKSKMDLPVVLFLLIIIISTLTSINPLGSFRDLSLHVGGLSLLFVMVNSITNKKDLNYIITGLVTSATIVAFYGLYQYLLGVKMDTGWIDTANNPGITTRVYSVFDNPNILAEYLVMIIPLSVSLLYYERELGKKLVFSLTTFLMVLALILTLSRGGWLGFAFSALIFIILVKRRLLIALFPIGLGAILFLPDTLINRILSIGNLSDSSNAYRLGMWKISLDIIRDRWMAGVGLGYLPFKETFEDYTSTMATYHAHNTYLQTAAEMGIPGLIGFLFMVFSLFKYGIKDLLGGDDEYIRIMGAGILSGLGGIMVHGLFENILYLPKIIILFWLLVSLLLTLFRLTKAGD